MNITLDPSVRPTLSMDETARLLGIGRATAYAAVKAGDIPSIRIGRRRLVSTAALRRLLMLDHECDRSQARRSDTRRSLTPFSCGGVSLDRQVQLT